MLATITLLTSISVGAIYPLCFWLQFKSPLKNNFHRFHLGLPTVIVGVTLLFILPLQISDFLKTLAIVWALLLFVLTFFYWKKEFTVPAVVSLPCLLGIYFFVQLESYFISPSHALMLVSVLGASIFCCSLFAMNLGHWYLNVHGLPLIHLKRAVRVLHFFILIRLGWDLYFLLSQTMLYQGEVITEIKFIQNSDGFLLLLGLFFGTLFPFMSLFFAQEILRLRNTQATTGVLYVILCSILLGDIVYKYYAIKFGIYW